MNREKVREKFGLASMRRKAGVDVNPVKLSLEPDDDRAGAGDLSVEPLSEPDETEA